MHATDLSKSAGCAGGSLCRYTGADVEILSRYRLLFGTENDRYVPHAANVADLSGPRVSKQP